MRRTPKFGSCPWCGSEMEVGDEDPILERCCGICATKPMHKLRELNPTFAKRHRKAERELYGRRDSDL